MKAIVRRICTIPHIFGSTSALIESFFFFDMAEQGSFNINIFDGAFSTLPLHSPLQAKGPVPLPCTWAARINLPYCAHGYIEADLLSN